MPQQDQNKLHTPVLLAAVLEYLAPQPGERYLDLTAGYGGHAGAILQLTQALGGAVLVDRDGAAIKELKARFSGSGIEIRHQDFYSASLNLSQSKRQFDVILADLGLSSPHLNMASRGFSLQQAGPLDMRMDKSQTLSAADIVNGYSEKRLAQIIKDFGEDPKARSIARLIVANRPISNTEQLAKIVARAWPGHFKVHPATRTFQAIRIAVNNELQQLEKSLPIWCDQLLADNGRLAIISFHSLEDRLVKQTLVERSGQDYEASLRLLTKKPVVSDQNEIVLNPRARSAKLRAAAKIKK